MQAQLHPEERRDCLLEAHEVVVSLAGVIQTASVVHGDGVTLLGEVGAVARSQSLLFDAHCE